MLERWWLYLRSHVLCCACCVERRHTNCIARWCFWNFWILTPQCVSSLFFHATFKPIHDWFPRTFDGEPSRNDLGCDGQHPRPIQLIDLSVGAWSGHSQIAINQRLSKTDGLQGKLQR
jgi:hypothetical protein